MENFEQVTRDLGGLEAVTVRLVRSVTQSLTQAEKAMDTYTASTAAAAARLEKELLVLRLSFGSLKTAVTEAFAPIGAAALPTMNRAVRWMTGLVRSAGLVAAALFGGANAGVAMTDTLQSTAQAGEKAAAAGKRASRTLAGFDQITRLSSGSSGGGGGAAGTETAVSLPQTVTDTLSPQLQVIVERIRALLKPLQNIDFSLLTERLSGLAAAFQTMGSGIASALGWVWYQLLTPFAAWVGEQFAPTFTGTLTAALEAITAALTPAAQGFGLLLESMRPAAEFVGQTAVLVLGQLQKAFTLLAGVFAEKSPQITGIFQNIGAAATALFAAVSPVLTRLRERWLETCSGLCEAAAGGLAWIIDALNSLTGFLAGVFTGNWELAWNSIKALLKGAVNGIIGLLNKMLSGVAGAINGIVRAANRLRFTVPDWVPGLGGQTFGFQLSTVPVPQIPYLAQGAVLPANKPFLAMVGDQKHGTNIEAPLATIQEAVALVLEDAAASNLAGQEAILGVLRQILEAVLGISLSDEVFAKAADRYSYKMAVIKGGAL